MANILTASEAATVLRIDEDSQTLLDLLPAIDAYIRGATGHDWAADTPVIPEAKSAARILLVRWHEDPGAMAGQALTYGQAAMLVQLEALAERFYTFLGRDGAGAISLPGARIGDTVSSLVGKIGVTGDQAAAFEAVITVDDEIQQVSAADLSDYWYQAYLVPVSAL
jgi:hypothetical protein